MKHLGTCEQGQPIKRLQLALLDPLMDEHQVRGRLWTHARHALRLWILELLAQGDMILTEFIHMWVRGVDAHAWD